MKRVKVLGLGNFGFAILKHLDRKNNGAYQLSGFARNPSVVDHLSKKHKHPYFPNISPLSKETTFENDLKEFVKDADFLVMAVPSKAISEVLETVKDDMNGKVTIINTAKALHQETGERLSEVVSKVLKGRDYFYSLITGGTIAQDMMEGNPLGVNIACRDKKALGDLTGIFHADNLVVYPTHDLKGVEYASAFKNVISLFSGIIQGLGLPASPGVFLITKIIHESEKLIINELGGHRSTFSLWNPCWGGDIWLSCVGNTRNREFGMILGKGQSIEKTMIDMNSKTVEGIYTIMILDKLANLENYPFLDFLSKFFKGKASLKELLHLIKSSKVLEEFNGVV